MLQKPRAYVRIMEMVGLNSPEQARELCAKIRQFVVGDNPSNTQIADCIETHYKPGTSAKDIATVLSNIHSTNPVSNKQALGSKADKILRRAVGQIAKVMKCDRTQAMRFCEEFLAIRPDMSPAFIAQALKELHATEKKYSKKQILALAMDLRQQAIQKAKASLKEKHLPYVPAERLPPPKYVVDEWGSVTINPALEEYKKRVAGT